VDNTNNSIVINFNDDVAVDRFNKFKEKHGFATDAEVIQTAYIMMLSLDESNSLHFLKNGKFMITGKPEAMV
jgi:arginine utilization protein RocB